MFRGNTTLHVRFVKFQYDATARVRRGEFDFTDGMSLVSCSRDVWPMQHSFDVPHAGADGRAN